MRPSGDILSSWTVIILPVDFARAQAMLLTRGQPRKWMLFKFSSENIEKLAIALLDCLKRVGEKYVKEDVVGEDAETIRMRIYAEALARLMRRKEWKRIFGKTSYS